MIKINFMPKYVRFNLLHKKKLFLSNFLKNKKNFEFLSLITSRRRHVEPVEELLFMINLAVERLLKDSPNCDLYLITDSLLVL